MSFSDLIQKKFGPTDEVEPELQPSPAGSLEAFIQRHGHKTEEYHFYGDAVTLRFDTEEHVYYRVGELGNLIRLNGVTNVVGIIDKSMMLTPWAAKMAIQKLLRIMPTEMVDGIIRIKPLTFEEFTVIALEAKGAHKEKLDEASDIGHLAHKCIEDSINYALANDPEKSVRNLINIPTDEQAANAANSALSWMRAHHVRWEETESKIYSLQYDYAGTCDGICVVDSCTDKACCPVDFKDRRSMSDWKSSNHLKIEYLFQVCAYKHAKLEEYPNLPIDDIWILRLGKSEEEAGKFEPWHMTSDEYETDFQGFLSCLMLTRIVDQVKERMRMQKGTIRAIKKVQRETAKALAKEQEKLQKAMAKATAKLEREKEKLRIKAEAKATRDALKAAKYLEKVMPVTTAILKMMAVDIARTEDLPEGCEPRTDDVVYLGGDTVCMYTSTMVSEDLQSDTTYPFPSEGKDSPTPPPTSSLPSPTTAAPETQEPESTTSMVETMTLSQADQRAVVEALANPPEPNAALKAAFKRYEVESFETAYFAPTFKLPMEG